MFVSILISRYDKENLPLFLGVIKCKNQFVGGVGAESPWSVGYQMFEAPQYFTGSPPMIHLY